MLVSFDLFYFSKTFSLFLIYCFCSLSIKKCQFNKNVGISHLVYRNLPPKLQMMLLRGKIDLRVAPKED